MKYPASAVRFRSGPFMAITHTKEYGVYHWDTFDNETILLNEFDTIEEAEEYIKKKYEGRLNPVQGADKVEIVDQKGKIRRSYATC